MSSSYDECDQSFGLLDIEISYEDKPKEKTISPELMVYNIQ